MLASFMDEHLTISTPEQVAFHYEMAGIGSRFIASLLDHTILVVAMVLIYCGAFALGATGVVAAGGSEEGLAGFYLLLAVIVIIIFLLFWGYFVIFELVWNGQTPGKRAARLRVIRRDGQPVSAGEVMIRNLVRIIDFMPGFYGIGLITMFIDKEARRLGDFAAGTIVVREGEQTRLRDVRVPEPDPSHTPHSALPGISLRDVTPDDYRLIREMLARVSRGELSRERGQELAHHLAHGVAARMGHDFGQWQARGWDPLVFLESVLAAREARGE